MRLREPHLGTSARPAPAASRQRPRLVVCAFGLLLAALGALLGGTEATAREHANASRRDDYCALGRLYFDEAQLERARGCFEAALAYDGLYGRAHAGMASVQIARGRPASALRHLALARMSPSPVPASILETLRAQALLLQRRNDAARDAAEAGLRQAPFHAPLVEVRAQIAFRMKDMRLAQRMYRRAASLDPTLESANIRLGSGFGPKLRGTPWRDPPQRDLFRAACDAWLRVDLRAAQEQFASLAARWPDNFKYRLGLGMVLRERRMARYAGPGGRARYRLLPAPDVPGIERFIPQWARLDDASRHVVRVAVAPAARWLPEMMKRRARHDVLSLDDVLTEAMERSQYTTTFDGRRWRQLRGIGGREAATGIEKLRIAEYFAFNTFAHEFAHQLLSYAFAKKLQEEVQTLYLTALDEDRCLDYYAASNVDEYFAQGYEAFVSLHKNARMRVTAAHTRAELKRRDPALHAFFVRELDMRHETEAALAPFWDAAQGNR